MPNRLAQWLEETGTTQAELSRASGVQAPLICDYVHGNRRPGLDAAFALERATGGKVPASYWTGLQPIPNGTRKAV